MSGKAIEERSVAFIVARLSSSRLPAKHLRSIGGRKLLQWVVDRLQLCELLDEIVLATVDEPENLPLKDFALQSHIACYWYEGEVDHVTHRLRCAAERFEADICVLVSADCPLIHAPAIDQMVAALKANPDADTVWLGADAAGRPPALQGVLVNRKSAWQLADDLADRPELREHQFPVLGLRPELFHPVDVRLSSTLYMPYHRLSVDTLSDLDFMNALHDALGEEQLPFRLPEAVALLENRPDLKAINSHVHQRRLVDDIHNVLVAVDAGGSYGFGHLMRSMELARQITERLGWPTHFLVDDPHAKAKIEAAGGRVHWGAFGRSSRAAGDQRPSTVESLIEHYDLLLVDIFDQCGPQPGWRSKIGRDVKCVVIENTQPWAREADMILLPIILNDGVKEIAGLFTNS
jgi:spore coat polysaccharide biosynthesis protein SpsF